MWLRKETLQPRESLLPYWKGSVLGMPVYEGTARMLSIHRRAGVTSDWPKEKDVVHEWMPISARIIIGSDIDVSEKLEDHYFYPDIFTQTFISGYSQLSLAAGFMEPDLFGEDGTSNSHVALKTMLTRAQMFPHIPITLLYAHGDSNGGEQYVQTVNDHSFVRFRHAVEQIMKFDQSKERLYRRDELTIVLSACNNEQVAIDDEALIIYRSGIAGLLNSTGDIEVSRKI